MQTLYTIDLMKQGRHSDPLNRRLSMATTYRVSGIDSSVYTRDIVRVLMHVRDTNPEGNGNINNVEGEEGDSQKVGYEIVWIDDHSFMVAARSPGYGADQIVLSPDAETEKSIQSTLMRHGALIRSALETRFPTQTIVTLEEHVAGKSGEMMRRTDSVGKLFQIPFQIPRLISNFILRVLVGDKKRHRQEEEAEDDQRRDRAQRRRV